MALQELDAKTNHSGSSHKNFGILKNKLLVFSLNMFCFQTKALTFVKPSGLNFPLFWTTSPIDSLKT